MTTVNSVGTVGSAHGAANNKFLLAAVFCVVAAALEAKMKVLLEGPSLAKRMGEAGRRRAETEFAAAKSLAKLELLITESLIF